MLVLQLINTGYKLGTFQQMPRKYRKDYISPNGKNYYLQFHIADWMRNLPAFRNYSASTKNFKRTLRTSDPLLAAQRADVLLKELQIKPNPSAKPLEQGADAYFGVLTDIETRSDDELQRYHQHYKDSFDESFGPAAVIGDEAQIDSPELYGHTHNALAAVEREMRRREGGRLFDEPHPYSITLLQASSKFMEDMASEGRPKKTQSKVINASKRFLLFIERPDVELKLITSKLVADYVKHARKEQRAENTFKNDIHYLGGVFRWANQEGYLENLNNPFRDVRIRGLKNKINKLPFAPNILSEILKLDKIVNDNDLSQLVWVSYYTGMRISEVFTAKFITVDDVLCFDVASTGGKTESAPRIIPVHKDLIDRLAVRYQYADGEALHWASPNDTALGKRFGRVKTQIIENLNGENSSAQYGHHSFRHGFITNLLQAGYSELEISDLTGHKKSNIGRLEAGKTYFSRQSIIKLRHMIDAVPKLEPH
ncbi:tyrosine-type recombinase/integrase [Alphaproteobacteria bacterium]|nr:tyrosine-type recombinase/integrase [Alphaproteobacteria bacterium]